jgi:recombination protein RecA
MGEQERKQQLQSTVSTIKARWGERAITMAHEWLPPPSLPSGISSLDAILPAGGFPCGQISELSGYGTAGHLPIAARTLAQAQQASTQRALPQRQRQQALVVDATRHLDIATLAHCGAHLDTLAVLQSRDFSHALQMTSDLLGAGFAGVVLFDRLHDLYTLANGEVLHRLEQALRDWAPLLARSSATLLWITDLSAPGSYPEGLPLAYAASVRLMCERQRWLTEGQRVTGYVSRITLLKSRGGAQASSVSLRFTLA